MEEGKRARAVVLALAVLIGVGLTSIPALGLSASPDNVVTVCLSGPPTCDYQTIQEGIDAASAGDTVLVSSGVYTEQVTLKSGIVLESSGGPEETTITAIVGPVITASQAISTSIRGFTISGLGVLTTSTGAEFYNSDAVLQNCVIEDFCGASGDETMPDGENAVAIRFRGSGALMIVSTTIQNIAGGDGFADYVVDANGGSAIGVWASDVGRVTITDASIQSLFGGDASIESYWDTKGGQAVGVRVEGDVGLTIDKSKFVDLVGGGPTGQPGPCYSVDNAGNPVGVQAMGGTVVLRDNLFSHFSLQAAYDSEPGYAVRTLHTSVAHIEGNTIVSLWAESSRWWLPAAHPDSFSHAPLVPFCPREGGSVVAIVSEGDALLRVIGNSLGDLQGVGQDGQATGISVQDAGSVVLAENSIVGIVGGYSGPRGPSATAVGIRLEDVNSAEITANALDKVRGADMPQIVYLSDLKGGGVLGIDLRGVRKATVTNNSIWSLAGGQGAVVNWGLGRGSDAIALNVVDGTASVWNNVFYQTTAGVGGIDLDGQPGNAIGLRFTEGADVLAVNNAVISHSVGISSTARNTPILGYNDLWDNAADYAGVSPGANDLHVPPGFVDAANGDFHLLPGSPLIDAGTNASTPDEDFEGEPRPLDGNDDGLPIADIGADEYWLGLAGSAKTVDASIASSGDTLAYQIMLVNQSSYRDLPGVVLTDVLPVKTTYVTGTLAGSAGTWGHAEGMITWTGTISAGQAVTLTFDTVAGGDPAVPYAVINQALLDDRIGKTRVLQAVTLMNPLRFYLPAVFR